MTNWTEFDSEYNGMDGVFVPIQSTDRVNLRRMLREAIADELEHEEEVDEQFYMERLEATHFFIQVTTPDGEHGVDYDDDSTWWDFGSFLTKQVDGQWYAWSDDVYDVGNVWFQSTYTKSQAYKVRDIHIKHAEVGSMLEDGNPAYLECKSTVMTFW